MGRSALLLVLALFTATTLNAQRFDLGPKFGLNRDDLKTTYPHEPLLGGHLGLFARFKPPLLPGLQGEALLSSFGSRVSVEGQEAELRMLTLQTPLFLVISIGPVELHGGGYYKYQLSPWFVNDMEVEVEGEQVSIADLNEDGFGLLVGAGAHFGHFYTGLRYNVDMNSIGQGPFLDDVYGRQWQFYVGFGLLGGSGQ